MPVRSGEHPSFAWKALGVQSSMPFAASLACTLGHNHQRSMTLEPKEIERTGIANSDKMDALTDDLYTKGILT